MIIIDGKEGKYILYRVVAEEGTSEVKKKKIAGTSVHILRGEKGEKHYLPTIHSYGAERSFALGHNKDRANKLCYDKIIEWAAREDCLKKETIIDQTDRGKANKLEKTSASSNKE